MNQTIANTSVYIPPSVCGTSVNWIQEQPVTEIHPLYVNAFRKQYVNKGTNFLLGEQKTNEWMNEWVWWSSWCWTAAWLLLHPENKILFILCITISTATVSVIIIIIINNKLYNKVKKLILQMRYFKVNIYKPTYQLIVAIFLLLSDKYAFIIYPLWNSKCNLILRWAGWSPPSHKCYFNSWCLLPAVACSQSVTAAADDVNNSESLLPTAVVAAKRNYGIEIRDSCCKCACFNVTWKFTPLLKFMC